MAAQEQIAELTRGTELPLEALHRVHLEVVIEFIGRAWSELCEKHSLVMSTGSEAEINALLESRLNSILRDEPLLRNLISCVVRGRESIDVTGEKLEKRPDLSLILTRRSPSFPLTVECKIVDVNTGKTLELYCSKGILRFIDGQYAWAAQEALMLGYVRDESSLEPDLVERLKLRQGAPPAGLNFVNPLTCESEELGYAKHNRAFSYIGSPPGGSSPGPIYIWHLWLVCPGE